MQPLPGPAGPGGSRGSGGHPRDPAAEAAQAHALLEENETFGKVVLDWTV